MPNKIRGEVTDITVIDGLVKCTVEDLEVPQRSYNDVIYGSSTVSSIEVPPINTEVLVEYVGGEKVVTSVLSTPGKTGMEDAVVEAAAGAQYGSMSIVLDGRDSNSSPEKLSIEYSSDGYDVSVDVDGNVNVDAGGDVDVSADGAVDVSADGAVDVSAGGGVSVTATDSISVSADQDVNIDAAGNVSISEGGTTKKVLTEDAKFEYEDTGDTSDGTASATTKKTTTVVNAGTTDVELE